MLKKILCTAALALGLTAGAHAADKPTLTFGYVNGWDDSVATSHVAARSCAASSAIRWNSRRWKPPSCGRAWRAATWTPPSPPGCRPPTASTTRA